MEKFEPAVRESGIEETQVRSSAEQDFIRRRLERPREHKSKAPAIPRARRDAPLPLSFAQQRIWFLQELAPGNPFYNIPAAVPLKGPIDTAALEAALNTIVERHESLRTVIRRVDGRPRQTVRPHQHTALDLLDLSPHGVAEAEQTYPLVLQEILRARYPGWDVEVLNTGVLGYSSYQGLVWLGDEIVRYQPDLVLTYFGLHEMLIPEVRSMEDYGPYLVSPLQRKLLRSRTLAFYTMTHWVHQRGYVRSFGETVAETTRARFLFETGLPARYYVPPEDVRADLLVPSETVTACPYKGQASYHSLRVGAQTYENLVWFYPDPLPEVARIKDHLCFFNEKVDVILLDGEEVPKPKTKWS